MHSEWGLQCNLIDGNQINLFHIRQKGTEVLITISHHHLELKKDPVNAILKMCSICVKQLHVHLSSFLDNITVAHNFLFYKILELDLLICPTIIAFKVSITQKLSEVDPQCLF